MVNTARMSSIRRTKSEVDGVNVQCRDTVSPMYHVHRVDSENGYLLEDVEEVDSSRANHAFLDAPMFGEGMGILLSR
eukprot:scaffold23803_cov132-Cylindrotheca_fusiformis.AAC.3